MMSVPKNLCQMENISRQTIDVLKYLLLTSYICSLGLRRIPCIGHLIHNAVLKSLASEEVERMLVRCRQIVALFHKSHLYRAKLLEHQKKLLLPQQQLINDVSTGWGSKYKMVKRIREQLNAINRIFIDDKKNRHLHIDVKDSVTLDQILKALEGFELLTDLLSGDKEVTVSSAIPLLRHVHRLCRHDRDDEVITMDIKTTIEPYITENVKEVVETSEQTAKRKRLKKPEKAKILLFLCVAEVLNPRYLGVSTATDEVADNWLPWPELDDVNEEIIRLGMELWAAQNEETEKETQDQEYQAEKPKRKSLASLLLTSTTANSTANSEPQTQKPAQMLRRELEFYLQLTVHPEIDLLQWWKGHMKELPLLGSLARYVLSSCATSVTSERLFSLAGHISVKGVML